MGTVALSFGTPEHGWLSVTLSSGGREQVLVVSDMPTDSLRMLASAILHVVGGQEHETSVEWCLEPDVVTWFFRRHEGQCELLVLSPEVGAQPETFAVGTTKDVCAPMWRALRRLEADPAWAGTTSSAGCWSHPFPSTEVARLGELLREGELV